MTESQFNGNTNICACHNTTDNVTCLGNIYLNNENYSIDEIVIIKEPKDIAVAKLLCIYVDNEKDVEAAVIRKYIFGRNIKNIFLKHGIEFDNKNEVVEDLSKNYVIDVKNIQKKCALVILSEDDDPYYIQNSNLNPDVHFSCRFILKSKKLLSIFDKIIFSSLTKKSKMKPKKKADNECTPITNVEELKRISNSNNRHFSPQRNTVKRNLNKSFGNSPCDSNDSILNYSIANLPDDEEEVNPLVLKLRVSKRNKNNIAQNNVETSPGRRRSVRQLPRVSYADFISPVKTTPTKRQHTKPNTDEDYTPRKVGRNKKTEIIEEFATSNEIHSKENNISKREIKIPKKYQSASPISISDSPYSTRKSRRINSISSYKENELFDVPKPSANLDDSLRTSILKVHIDNLNIRKFANNKEKRDSGCSDESLNDSDDDGPIRRIYYRKPRTKRKPIRSSSEDEMDSDNCLKTPKKSPRKSKPTNTPRSTQKHTPKTPRNIAKLIRDGVVTPSMHARSKSITGVTTPLMKARSQLHVSYLPKTLPCRDNEYNNVYSFLEGKLFDGCGGCMYVSGVPGTGKTATVTSAINDLGTNKDVPNFNYVNINGMRLTEPRQAYVEIVKQLLDKTVPWEQAQGILEDLFVKSKKLKPVIILIDELDILCTKRQDVVYNLLDWPTKAKNQLIVVTIANTMDLPERLLMSRVTSRLGLTRLTFQAYTYKQLQEIVTERLSGTDSFNPDAVQFVARKVASVSGDARRALDICRRAAEIAESEGKGQLVNMTHVNEALNAMITQPKVRAIKNCSRLGQLILQAIVAEVERTGVEETTFADVFKMLVSCVAIDGFQMVSTTVALGMVSKLSACRLILTDQKCSNIYQRIILNVSADDVYYALKKD